MMVHPYTDNNAVLVDLGVDNTLNHLTVVDSEGKLQIINLNEYFLEFPDNLLCNKQTNRNTFQTSLRYDPDDEDVLLSMSGVDSIGPLGDKMWKAELGWLRSNTVLKYLGGYGMWLCYLLLVS